MKLENAITKYLNYNQQYLNKSLNTIKSYKYDLNKYVKFCQQRNLNYITITRNEINNFIIQLGKKDKLSPNSVNRIISALKSFYKFLVKHDIVQTNVIENIHQLKTTHKLPNFLSYEEVIQIINYDWKEKNQQRDRLIIGLMFFGGLRISEVCSLKYDDLFLEDDYMVVNGKNAKQRYVFIVEELKYLLNDYIEQDNLREKYLIKNFLQKQISRQSLWKIVKGKSKQTSTKITPHTFRHSFATYLLERGLTQYEIKELLGHSSINTTQIYVHVTNKELKKTFISKINDINLELKED